MDVLALKRVFTVRKKDKKNVFHVEIDRKSEISKVLYLRGSGNFTLRITLPVDMLVTVAAFSFNSGFNPFLAPLRGGPDKLRWFYETFQPEKICDTYGLAARGRRGEDLPPWEIPWYYRPVRTAPPGERGLGAEHGLSFYGPASDRKVALECRRLRGTRDSIERYGFDPDRYSDITGYFLRSGEDYRFYVIGGKHRTAAMVDLGYETIPVVMKPHWPRLIDRDRAHEWPLVQSGAMDEGLARDIFDRYFNPGGFDWLDAD
jgi:hypothetical protein